MSIVVRVGGLCPTCISGDNLHLRVGPLIRTVHLADMQGRIRLSSTTAHQYKHCTTHKVTIGFHTNYSLPLKTVSISDYDLGSYL